MTNPICLGIDPGYDRLGWAIASQDHKQWSMVKCGCIQTDKNHDLFSRYQQLSSELQLVIQEYQPTEAAIESLFFFKNKKTALKVSESRGVVINVLLQHQLAITEYTPLQIKEAVTGYGRADKRAVKKMLCHEFGKFAESINDDALDALGVILTHYIRSANSKIQLIK